MDDETLEKEAQEQIDYMPRPKWQIWGARIGLVLFILLLILYYTNLFRGGV